MLCFLNTFSRSKHRARILLLALGLIGCGNVIALPPAAEQVFQEQVLQHFMRSDACAEYGSSACKDLRILQVKTMSLLPAMQDAGIDTAWCVQWGGMQRHPILGDWYEFKHQNIVAHTTQGYQARYSILDGEHWNCPQ